MNGEEERCISRVQIFIIMALQELDGKNLFALVKIYGPLKIFSAQ